MQLGTVELPGAGAPPPAPLQPGGADLETRILDATLRCIGRWGATKTTLDDVAREAGCSRATVYRTFPGGKESLLRTLLAREVAILFAAVDSRLAAAPTFHQGVVGAMTEAGRRIAGHRALQFLLAHEPGTVLPHLAFSKMDRGLRTAAALLAPSLVRWLGDDAERAAEWLCRLMLTYLVCPSAEVDTTDAASVDHLVRRFVLPIFGGPTPCAGPAGPDPARPDPARDTSGAVPLGS